MKAKAAAALLNNGKDAPDSDILRDPDAPQMYAVLPDNVRQADLRYGVYSDDQTVVIVPDGWPMEVMPESHYAGVARPVGVVENRAERRRLAAPSEDESRVIISRSYTEAVNKLFGAPEHSSSWHAYSPR